MGGGWRLQPRLAHHPWYLSALTHTLTVMVMLRVDRCILKAAFPTEQFADCPSPPPDGPSGWRRASNTRALRLPLFAHLAHDFAQLVEVHVGVEEAEHVATDRVHRAELGDDGRRAREVRVVGPVMFFTEPGTGASSR